MKLHQIQEWAKNKFKVMVSRSTVYRITKARDGAYEGPDGRKKNRRVRFPDFESAFLAFDAVNDGKAILTDDLLLEEARTSRDRLGINENDLHVSNGWLEKFKKRHNIKQHTLHGESDKVDLASLEVARIQLRDLIGQYSADDVYNFDEAALLYRLPPNKTLATVKRNGSEVEKDRLTVAFCCNMTGTDKLNMTVIGKSQRPKLQQPKCHLDCM